MMSALRPRYLSDPPPRCRQGWLIHCSKTMLGIAEVVQQEHPVWCWEAVVQMLRRHFGMVERRQCEIVSARVVLNCCQAPMPGGCGVPHRMDSFDALLRSEGIACRVDVPPGPLDERTLSDELHSDRPVVIGWIWHQASGGHFALAFMRPKAGARKPNRMFYWVADPLQGVRRYTYEALLQPTDGIWGWSWYNLEVR